MEKYAYLLLGILLVSVFFVGCVLRPDLRRVSVKVGLMGGIAGLLAEFFYFRDYWRPPSLMGVAKISIEDFLFGFAITAASVMIYPLITKTVFKKGDYNNYKKLYGIFFLIGLSAMIIFNVISGINSIFVSSFMFLIFSTFILVKRNDLIPVAVKSTLVVIGIIIAIYILIFNILAPDFWDKYWLLADTWWGITFLGNIPATEIFWYFSWILFASISYPFASGKELA
jgi:hypothetical protein